jgi:3-deoxy-7-phosphoheptulonate synthase
MVIVMQPGAAEAEIDGAIRSVHEHGFRAHTIRGVNLTVIAVVGDETHRYREVFEALPGVSHIARIDRPYKLAARRPEQRTATPIDVGTVTVGGPAIVVVAGPCAIEDAESLFATAEALKASGASILRGGAFKPRTSPYSFQGLGKRGLEILREAGNRTGLPVVTEVMDTRVTDLVAEFADMLQIGARNMQNFALLSEVGRTGKPVLLKRGLSNTVEDLLMAAEYIMSAGNERIILCERGIRTFETGTRNTLDLSAVPQIKRLSHLPVLVDPSHGTGHAWMVPAMAKAAVACGADALMTEVHHDPPNAESDGPQSLTPEAFARMMDELRPVAEAVGRRL